MGRSKGMPRRYPNLRPFRRRTEPISKRWWIISTSFRMALLRGTKTLVGARARSNSTPAACHAGVSDGTANDQGINSHDVTDSFWLWRQRVKSRYAGSGATAKPTPASGTTGTDDGCGNGSSGWLLRRHQLYVINPNKYGIVLQFPSEFYEMNKYTRQLFMKS